jgi:hypothetical protein
MEPMARDTDRDASVQDMMGVVRRVGPWVLLFVVMIWVFTLYGQYKGSKAVISTPAGSISATSSAETTASTSKKPAVKGASGKAATASAGINAPSQVRIVSDVNMHDQPNASANVIRVLKSGETLVLVGQSGSWYKVTDSSGAIGYVTKSTTYTKLVPGK